MTVLFWGIIIIAIAICLFIILRPLALNTHLNDDEHSRDKENINLYNRQLHDLDSQYRFNNLSETDYQRQKQEIQRRLLDNVDNKQQFSTAPLLITPLIIAIGFPLLATLLYIHLGQPKAIKTTLQQQAHKPTTLIKQLQEHLRTKPDDNDAKLMLANTYTSQQDYTRAISLYKHLYQQIPDKPDLLLAYAEALARHNHNDLRGKPEKLIQQALHLDPGNKKANWLAGIASFQNGDNQTAIAIWQQQLQQADNSTQERQLLQTFIDKASNTTSLSAAQESPRIDVSVSLDDTLQDQLNPAATLFIFARAASGPPMPLAVIRRQASDLPLSVTLSNANAMVAGMNLSQFKHIIIGARLSNSDAALPANGDLQGFSPTITSRSQQVHVIIDTIVK